MNLIQLRQLAENYAGEPSDGHLSALLEAMMDLPLDCWPECLNRGRPMTFSDALDSLEALQ